MSGTITARELAARLGSLPPADVPALRLLLEIKAAEREGRLNTAYLLERKAEIEAAIKSMSGLDQQLRVTMGIIRRCERLPSVPSKRIPVGL
jgi:hypothetical protein